jgi:hypothetical protein
VRRPASLLSLIITYIVAMAFSPANNVSASATLAIQSPATTLLADPAASAKTTGRKVLQDIIQESTGFAANLVIDGAQPALKDWATCALAFVDNKIPTPIWYPIKNNGKIVETNWNCSVTFVNGRASSARINLNNGSIRQVRVATINGNTRAIRAAFIKETICTRLALEQNLIGGKLYNDMDQKTRMSQYQIIDKLATYVDGLAVYCLPKAERQALGVPNYVPMNETGLKLCKAIDRLSREGYIRPGGLGQFLKICGQ